MGIFEKKTCTSTDYESGVLKYVADRFSQISCVGDRFIGYCPLGTEYCVSSSAKMDFVLVASSTT